VSAATGPISVRTVGVAVPQPGIFALGTRAHHHLELDLTGRGTDLVPALARIREAANSVLGVNVVVGFGPSVWSQIAPDHVPAGVSDFTTITGPDGFEVPARQHDVWVWLHGAGPDSVFDIARLTARELAGCAEVVCEQPSFTYRASQDLTGFEDGTENPPLDEAPGAATIEAGPCQGGSVALLQRWVHDLAGFEELDGGEKERIIGRTLDGSKELDPATRPPTCHIDRVVLEDDEGEELEIFRRSTSFGGVKEHGLMFVGFSADVHRLCRMLERMAGSGDGIRDALTTVSTPVASAWYVVPPIDLLRELAG
jgi:putative iron-dependent peroxidase